LSYIFSLGKFSSLQKAAKEYIFGIPQSYNLSFWHDFLKFFVEIGFQEFCGDEFFFEEFKK